MARIRVERVIVRCVAWRGHIQMTVEGSLPNETMAALSADPADKLSQIEQASCVVRRID